MTLSIACQICGVVNGSLLKLSSAAQRKVPAFNAAASAASSINPPRAVFTRMAPGLHCASVAALIIPLFCCVKGQ